MTSLRQILAFPMYGAAIWLVWVLSLQAGSDGLLVALGSALALAFGLWALGRAQMSDGFGRTAGFVTAAVALLGAVGLTSYAGTFSAPATAAPQVAAESAIPYEPYTAARLEALRAEGRPVFINATAAWCITCLVNERVALSGDGLKTEFEQKKVAALKADWTNQNPEITALLTAQQRSGVPLYLYYAPGAQVRSCCRRSSPNPSCSRRSRADERKHRCRRGEEPRPQADQPDHDQIDRDQVIQQSRHDEDQNAEDERDQGLKSDHVDLHDKSPAG